MLSTHVIAGAAGAALVFGGLWMTALDRSPPLTIESAEVLTPQVHPGETLRVRYNFDRDRKCRTRAENILYDGAGVEYRFAPEVHDSFGPVERESRTLAVRIPEGASPGRARYRLILTWWCNPAQSALGLPISKAQPDLVFNIEGQDNDD